MPSSAYTPSRDAVATLVRTRTVDSNGNELGAFSVNTRPNIAQADAVILDAMNEAYPFFGLNIPDAPGDKTLPGYDADALRKAASQAVAYRAAALIELSYFPEQVAAGRSPYQQYEDTWERMVKSLSSSIQEAGGGDAADSGSGSGGDGYQMASFSFPVDQGGIVSWGTRF